MHLTSRPACLVATLGLLTTSLAAQTQFRLSRNLVYPNGIPRTIYNTATADVNGDGRRDLLFACDYAGVFVFVNDGHGRFVDETAMRLPSPVRYASYEVTAADLDGDGDQDLVVANDHVYENKILINDGRGRFRDESAIRLPSNGHWTTAQEILDVDGDGDLDIFFHNSSNQASHLFLNNGQGRFTDVSATHLPTYAAIYKPWVAAGDLDGDGDLDLVIEATSPMVLENTGGGRFVVSTRIAFPGGGSSPAVLRDFDGDGRVDVYFRTTRRYYLNQGGGVFRDATATHLPGSWNRLGFPVDVDMDGDIDLCGDGGLLLNDGTGRFRDASIRMPGVRFAVHLPQFADFDGDGDVDIAAPFAGLLVNFHRQIEAPTVPTLGGTYTVELERRPGYVQSSAFAMLAVAHKPLAAAVLAPPLGYFQLDPSIMLVLPPLFLPAATGKASASFPVPTAPAYRGLTVCFQALWIEPSGQAAFSNHTVDAIR